ncbi:tRNA-uridine aminocarboxypropyltransferase 1 [Brienomyrus brachyistius]|uniref:tRNA-uridine aminocarboxypropyltransferase 1 n=1 Tax=Brienomyrus brachyistius TaxID=42636 RepID=UPI0020B34D06|nr:tRNA-uridine aminocarboxypropyltransferase 1 [Brienomyrus brachyistius]
MEKSGMSTKQKEKNECSHLGDASEMKGKPFDGLKLASHEVLEKAQMTGRSKCPKCNGSRMFYCYTCFSLVGVSQDDVPKIKLPVKIDIIKHPHETDGKSTAVHAKLIAPDDVTVYTYPCIPEYENEKYKVVLVFPGPGSVTVEEMMEELLRVPGKGGAPSAGEPSPKRVKRDDESEERESTKLQQRDCVLQKVIFIDSTWNQTNKIISDERLQALLRVELKTRKTCFWRHQKGSPDTYLATIEAIYYFLKDYHVLCLSQDYQGDYDNLLYFFAYLHKLINSAKHAAGRL